MGDRGQLEQLLQNLIANALKFRDDERARVWVRVEASSNGMAQIAVADGGIGIAPEAREHVFEMFQRLHDRETYEGTGIGLAICRKIVERHGGRIWVDEREPAAAPCFASPSRPGNTPAPWETSPCPACRTRWKRARSSSGSSPTETTSPRARSSSRSRRTRPT